MSRRTANGRFQKGESGNPGGRPTLPADIREAFKAKAPQALEVLTRCLQSDDDRIAMMAAQAILDRGYGRPTQSIDVREDGPTVRYFAEMPEKCCNDGGMAGKHQAGGCRASAGHRRRCCCR